MNVPENALNYYAQACALDEAQGDHLSCAISLSCMGRLYMESSEWDNALKSYQQAIEHDKRIQNKDGLYDSLIQIAAIYSERKQWKRAQHCYEKALSLILHEDDNHPAHTESQTDEWKKANLYLKMGHLFEYLGNTVKALDYFQKARSSVSEGTLSHDSLDLLDQKIQTLTSTL